MGGWEKGLGGGGGQGFKMRWEGGEIKLGRGEEGEREEQGQKWRRQRRGQAEREETQGVRGRRL